MNEPTTSEPTPPPPPPTSDAAASAPSPLPVRRARGVGAMGPRLRRDDEPAPPREVVDAAATAARTSGHRFDLMRYLRLRRKQ